MPSFIRAVNGRVTATSMSLFKEALFHGIEVGLVVVIVIDLEGEIDALVVHDECWQERAFDWPPCSRFGQTRSTVPER
jgi:hypothetical protein